MSAAREKAASDADITFVTLLTPTMTSFVITDATTSLARLLLIELCFLTRDATMPRYLLSLRAYLSVRLSVTSRSPMKTAKRRIAQTTPHDSPWSQVL